MGSKPASHAPDMSAGRPMGLLMVMVVAAVAIFGAIVLISAKVNKLGSSIE